MQEISCDTNRWRNVPCLWIWKINIVKMCILPKAICRFNAIPIKLSIVFLTELDQITSQSVFKHKKTSNSQSNLEKQEWNWRNQTSWHQIIWQSYSHQENMVLAKDRNIDQWNKIESPEINPCTYGHLICDKGDKIYNGEKTISVTNGAGKTCQPHVKQWN